MENRNDASAPTDADVAAAALAASPDGFGVLRHCGNPADFVWVSANPALLRLLGEDRLTGRRLRQNGADGGGGLRLADLLIRAAFGAAPCADVIATRGGQRRMTAHGFAMPSGPAGENVHIALSVADADSAVNAFREQEERLRASEAAAQAARHDAEKASRAKSEFLTHMSHELRTPLNAIIGFAELMALETLGPLGNPHYADYIHDVLDSGRRLLELVEDALDLSRIDAGRLGLVEEIIDLAEAATTAAGRFADQAQRGGISLLTDAADRLPLLAADRRALHQMLDHLLSNALKFTPPGGSVMVSASPTPGGGVALMVADTGTGIAEEDLPRVILPFGRTEMTNKHCIDGSGLGLPIVVRLMELHGGRLELDSAIGAGATAILMFPAERVVGPHSLGAPPPRVDGK